MIRDELREQLYSKYFLDVPGIKLKDLMSRLSSVVETWKEFRSILKKNLKHFDKFNTLRSVKHFEFGNHEYLIIETGVFCFLVIDLKLNKVLNSEEVFSYFDDEFFYNNYLSREVDVKRFCSFEKCYDFKDILVFYNKNKHILNLPGKIYYKISVDETMTYISIDLLSDSVQLGFRTPEQFLYEHMHMNSNLEPYGMQDVGAKMGKDKMYEIFDSIGEAVIPREVIPIELLEFEDSNVLKMK